MHLFLALGNQSLEELQSRPHTSLKRGFLPLTGEVLFNMSKGHVVIPLPIFPLHRPTSSIHYNLIDSFSLPISLWIGWSGISILYPQITIVLLESFPIKLKTIVRDESMGDPESSNDILPDKSLDIHISDSSQRFSFNPFGEIVCAD